MRLIPDDPIVASMLRAGYPPWIDADDEENQDDGVIFPDDENEENEEE